ncbi:hypothetical protein Cgig2_024371 [Carnegiea gigantea]|uniref:RING-type E3 ubiquitin transferase n=1 Tax=Carnegiea gigantea TaxID=171969 RepID=A0A9Q1GM10_9CARY|nr:hypothetical protein Cgig2_024371 [Carnegiea gigantea]
MSYSRPDLNSLMLELLPVMVIKYIGLYQELKLTGRLRNILHRCILKSQPWMCNLKSTQSEVQMLVNPISACVLQVAGHDDIDPDNMTYEELLDLGEAVGMQSQGLSQELIRLLPTSRCVICLVTYKIGDQQRRLPCKLVYHSKCGRNFAEMSGCNSEVFEDKPRN